MADVVVKTVVQSIAIECSISEARQLLTYFGTLDGVGAPQVVRDISRKFRAAVESETFQTPVP